MQAKLKELAPDLAAESFRLGFADDGALGSGEADAYRHMMLVSVRLDDGSWLNFSSTTLGATRHADWSVLAVTICFGVAIVVVAVLLLRWATRPLRDLALAAERFSLDQTPQPLSESGPAEVRHAARAFNTMRERIQRLVSERMQALAAVSHDLRTPITRLRLRSELMEDEATRDLVDADLAEMEGMIDSTLEFLRGGVSSEAIRPIDDRLGDRDDRRRPWRPGTFGQPRRNRPWPRARPAARAQARLLERHRQCGETWNARHGRRHRNTRRPRHNGRGRRPRHSRQRYGARLPTLRPPRGNARA
nr:HAMP domain-containing protein [Bosea vaviloviae]